MILEVIATTLDQAKQAEKGKADRIELVSGMKEGGLTPSLGLFQAIKEEVSLPVAVMIRPHSKSFIYTSSDIKVMTKDIENFNKVGGVESFVLGPLTEEGEIDLTSLEKLSLACDKTPIVFHRALDLTKDHKRSLDIISKNPLIKRVLTSFGSDSSLKNKKELVTLVEYAKNLGIDILWGGGVSRENISIILNEIKPSQIHLGSAVRKDKNSIADIDKNLMKEFRNITT